jgi:drug/metabolite transporter (DMT)-like permease
MRGRDLGDLLLLAAVWGASFLFMRLGAVEFGPLALAFLRVAGASLLLWPLLWWQGRAGLLRQHWRPLAAVGLVNSALPFVLYGLAALVLSAGLMAIFNATAPLWAGLIAWAWLHERPTAWRLVGMGIGFAGVLGLSLGKASLQPGALGIAPAWGVAACLAATLLYGYGANLTRRSTAGLPALAVATGSQLAAAVVLLPLALWAWPAQWPGWRAWTAVALLAFVCTGLAYVLYFRLISRVGPARAISVTFLIPAFAAAWGYAVLGERPTLSMGLGFGVILLGTALSTGLLVPGWPRRAGSAAAVKKPPG